MLGHYVKTRRNKDIFNKRWGPRGGGGVRVCMCNVALRPQRPSGLLGMVLLYYFEAVKSPKSPAAHNPPPHPTLTTHPQKTGSQFWTQYSQKPKTQTKTDNSKRIPYLFTLNLFTARMVSNTFFAVYSIKNVCFTKHKIKTLPIKTQPVDCCMTSFKYVSSF